MGLNTHEWKYRVSDPITGRFWQIDPLAEEYTYNSTYAFQENKLGIGIELEGLEVMEWVNDIFDYFSGAGTAKDKLAQSQGANISDEEIESRNAKRLTTGLAGARAFTKQVPTNMLKSFGEQAYKALDKIAPDGVEFYGTSSLEVTGNESIGSELSGSGSLFLGNSMTQTDIGAGLTTGVGISGGGSSRRLNGSVGVNYFFATDGSGELSSSSYNGPETTGTLTIPYGKKSLEFNLIEGDSYIGFGFGIGPKSPLGFDIYKTTTVVQPLTVWDETIKEFITF